MLWWMLTIEHDPKYYQTESIPSMFVTIQSIVSCGPISTSHKQAYHELGRIDQAFGATQFGNSLQLKIVQYQRIQENN